MDEGKSGSKVISTILIVVLLAGLGFGGYFLGKFLDAQAAAKQAKEKPVSSVFRNDTLKIKFTFPSDWTKEEKIETDSAFVILRNKNGSEFVFSKSNTADSNIQVCDEEDPKGTAEGIEECTFISGGKIKFGRYKDTSNSSTEVGDTWVVLEPAEVTNPGKYLVDRAGFFYYIVKKDADLDTLDNIMKTVERL